MKAVRRLLAMVALALAGASSMAQFVKGNEAVKVMPDGTKKVETPPLPPATLAAPCSADKPACTASGWGKAFANARKSTHALEPAAHRPTARRNAPGCGL